MSAVASDGSGHRPDLTATPMPRNSIGADAYVAPENPNATLTKARKPQNALNTKH